MFKLFINNQINEIIPLHLFDGLHENFYIVFIDLCLCAESLAAGLAQLIGIGELLGEVVLHFLVEFPATWDVNDGVADLVLVFEVGHDGDVKDTMDAVIQVAVEIRAVLD